MPSRAKPKFANEPLFNVAGSLVRRVAQVHDALFARETAEYEVTPPQLAAIATIARHPGIELSPLAELVGYDPATLGSLVNRLAVKRLVRRNVGKHDRRTRQLYLTEKGKSLLDSVRPRTSQIHDLLLSPLSVEERSAFIDMMQRVILRSVEVDETGSDVA